MVYAYYSSRIYEVCVQQNISPVIIWHICFIWKVPHCGISFGDIYSGYLISLNDFFFI